MTFDKDNDFNDDYISQMIQIKDFLTTKSSIAGMGQIVVSSKEKPIVGTNALATCWGIVFYDRKNKKAYVAHAAPGVYMETLNKMVAMLDSSITQVEYGIIPGWDNYHEFGGKSSVLNLCDENKNPYYHMQNTLERISNIHFVPLQFDLDIRENRECGNYSYEFAFDANSCTNVTQYLFFDKNNYEINKHK